jgi:hypothetical protein
MRTTLTLKTTTIERRYLKVLNVEKEVLKKFTTIVVHGAAACVRACCV